MVYFLEKKNPNDVHNRKHIESNFWNEKKSLPTIEVNARTTILSTNQTKIFIEKKKDPIVLAII